MRVANIRASEYVNRRDEFEGSNTRGVQYIQGIYAVLSYGRHFPMYIYRESNSQWYRNKDKYSRTTSKHQSQLRPSVDSFIDLDTDNMIRLMNGDILEGGEVEE